MRLLFMALVTVHLLLRGMAVPCPHQPRDDAAGHSHRAHVHLSGHAHRHAPADSQRHAATQGAHARGVPLDRSSPDHGHDHDAVYLDDWLILAIGEQMSLQSVEIDWLTVPAAGMAIAEPVLEPQPRRARPPGDGVPTLHTLLPHVLRV